MIVKITYDDQRLDIFDTSTFTAPMPFGKDNMLTNFEVRFDTLGDGGLWAQAHYYSNDSRFKESGTGEIPVARWTKGWRFLLASAEEMKHVELVVVDGEAIMKRVLDVLIDLQAFDEAAYECIGTSSKGLHERICELHSYLKRTTGNEQPSVPGVPEEVIKALLEMQEQSDKNDEEEWGDLDEAGW